jgi:hydrogenase maturation protease
MTAMIAIIGYGNPLRSDDGLGQAAALLVEKALAADLSAPPVEVIACHQLTPELAEVVSRATRVIFIDAAAEGTPGTIRRQEVTTAASSSSLVHHLTPAALLGMVAALFGDQPQAILYSVSGENFAHGLPLSPRIQAVLPALVTAILNDCRE